MRIASFLPLIVIVLAAYFLFLRPQKARQRRAQELSSAIAPGQRVMTTAGMFATVVAVDDEGVTLEIAPGVHGRFVRQAVSRVVETEPEPFAGTEDDQDSERGAADAGEVDLVKRPDATGTAPADPYATEPYSTEPYTPAAPYTATPYDGPARVVDLGKAPQSEQETTDQTTSSSALH